MSQETSQIRLYDKDIERLKKFGYAGESLAIALGRVLDIAERTKK